MVPMDADEDPRSLPSSSSTATSAYRFFLGDSEGTLKCLEVACPPFADDHEAPLPMPIKIEGKKTAGKDHGTAGTEAVQKMAAGTIEGVGWVIAVARRNASIDVVLPHQEATSSGDGKSSSVVKATLLASILNDKMKAGIQRWIGLAVSPHGIYACTSAGDFIYARLSVDSASSSSTSPRLAVDKLQRLVFPEPLQALAFHPSEDPTHFVYGGEEVPLSMWHLPTALSPAPTETESPEEHEGPAHQNGGAEHEGNGSGNAKMRKRKRQAEARAKAREFLWGEVWRAKNLPNDALSLPRRPNITALSIMPGEVNLDAANKDPSAAPSVKIVVGTREGLLRIFEPASGVRKHTKEMKVVSGSGGSQQDAVKGICCTSQGEVIAADGSGKLYALDWLAGKIKYQWKDINGAISSMTPLPAPLAARRDSPYLLSCSMDRLVRLHSVPDAAMVATVKTPHGARGQILLGVFTGGSAATAAVWDGQVPRVAVSSDSLVDISMESGRNGHSRRHGTEDDGDDGGGEDSGSDDAVWAAMQEVGNEAGGDANGNRRSRAQQRSALRRKSGNSLTMGIDQKGGWQEEDDEDENAEKKQEDKSKRNRLD